MQRLSGGCISRRRLVTVHASWTQSHVNQEQMHMENKQTHPEMPPEEIPGGTGPTEMAPEKRRKIYTNATTLLKTAPIAGIAWGIYFTYHFLSGAHNTELSIEDFMRDEILAFIIAAFICRIILIAFLFLYPRFSIISKPKGFIARLNKPGFIQDLTKAEGYILFIEISISCLFAVFFFCFISALAAFIVFR